MSLVVRAEPSLAVRAEPNLGALSFPDVAAASARGALLVVPLGSTEQHGPHLTLSTDTDIALAICTRAAEQSRPTRGACTSLRIQRRARWLRRNPLHWSGALELLIVELCRSATDTFTRIVLVSGHGGNAEPLARAVATLRAEGRSVLAWSPSWDGDSHAGRTETSLQLALDPARVAIERATAGDTRPLAETLELLRTGGVRAVSPNGVLGDPRGASATEGAELLEYLTDQLLRALDQWVAA